jgi:hypothetical protein
MSTHVGQLTAQDELLIHQHHDTFASVATSDPSWTERVYGWAADAGGEVAVAFGLSRYLNRNVMDAYGLVAVGTTQYNVRASRRLYPEPSETAVGPLRYEVIEPLRAVRCVLEPNDAQPIAFDVTLTGTGRPQPEHHLVRRGYRRIDDVTRYVQIGQASGYVEVDGRRIELAPQDSLAIRDHSWGIRSGVGKPDPDDTAAGGVAEGSTLRMFWTPGRLDGPGGRTHIHLAHWDAESRRGRHDENTTTVTTPDGQLLHSTNVSWKPNFSPSGQIVKVDFECELEDGSRHDFLIEPIGASKVFLGPGLYGGYHGRYHGEDRGKLAVDGDLVADTADPLIAAPLHQLSQEIARVTDRVTGQSGWCALQVEMVGKFPHFGLPERLYR